MFLGWPILFISLGFNFLQYGLNPPPGGSSPEWGFLIPGVIFWIMGFGPLLLGIWGWRAARSGRSSSATVTLNRLRESVTPPANRAEFGGSFAAAAAGGDAVVDELERLSRLHASGSLTDDEFAAAKARILTTERLA